MPSILSNPRELVYRLLSVVLVLTVHEFAHGLAAYLLGDKTAKYDGRLSLNPLRHVDWFGLLALALFGFGWAKPVMVDPRNFKNGKVDFALTAAAGPIANIVLAFLLLLIAVPMSLNTPVTGITGAITTFLSHCSGLSLSLGFFNMLPIPPLDGSKIFGALLPDKLYFKYISMGQIGMIVLIALLYLGAFDSILMPLVSTTYNFMLKTLFSIFAPELGAFLY